MKKSKQSSALKHIELLKLPLKEIAVHPYLKKILGIQSNLEYLMTNNKLIDHESLKIYITLYPFFLVEEAGVYFSINNVRVLQLAKVFYLDEHEFNCCLLKGLDDGAIEEIAAIDFYLSHLLFSLRSEDAADQICRAFNELGDIKKVIAPEVSHLSNLAAALGVSRRTAYLKRKKDPKKVSTSAKNDNTGIKANSASAQNDDRDSINPASDASNLNNKHPGNHNE